MNRDEAKAILELCRPGILEDKEDPMIAEAMAFLDSDPELATWFEEQQTLDDRISDAFCAIEPPADLKASILAGMRAHSIQSENNSAAEDNVVSFQNAPEAKSTTSWFLKPWVGIAAAFVLLFVILGVNGTGGSEAKKQAYASTLQADLPQTIQFLATEISALGLFDKRSSEPQELKAYLASVDTPSPSYLPKPVEDVRSLGCYSFDFDGVRMGMICFKEDQLIHFTTMRKDESVDQFSAEPTIYETPDQAFKVWEKGDHVYILSIQGEKEDLPDFI